MKTDPKMVSSKAGVGIVEVEGKEGRFVCLDLGTAQIFLGPEDAIKLGRKIRDLGYEAGHVEKCNWCGSEKNVIKNECGKCRSKMKVAQGRAHQNFRDHHGKHTTMHQEYSKKLGYSGAESGAPAFDDPDKKE
jgi:hypothetical protein